MWGFVYLYESLEYPLSGQILIPGVLHTSHNFFILSDIIKMITAFSVKTYVYMVRCCAFVSKMWWFIVSLEKKCGVVALF